MTYREIYERALWDLEHNNITLGEFDERVKPLNQEPTGVEEELEKIKDKIKWEVNGQTGAFIKAYKVFDIIDNHISELKGE